MTQKLQRLFQLLSILKVGRSNLGTLCTELNVTERQIYRDIKTLRKQGYNIRKNEKTGNYTVCNNVVLPETQFDLEEAIALITLCHDVGNNKRIPFMHAAQRAAVKLQNIFPRELQDDIVEIGDALEIMPSPFNPLTETQSTFNAVLDSYRKGCSLRIGYKSPIEPELTTLLSPYRLVFYRRSWYAVGRSSLHREVRTFHVGRITSFQKTENAYKVPKGFTLKKYFGNAWRMIREPGQDQEVVIRFSPLVAQNVAEVIWHSTQRVQWNTDGSIDYHVTVSGLNEISWWILGYGKEADVLEPEKLRNIVKTHIEAMLKKY